VLTDVHTEAEVPAAAAVVDVLQTPAFLCRQTDFIQAVARSGKPVNIKKGQFLAPEDMAQVVAKARAASGADNILVCERGAAFGYHNLVSDMRSLAIMRATGARSYSMPRIRCNFRAGRATPAAGSASSSRCSRALPWPRALRACSWKRIPIRRKRCPTAPTRGRSRECARCSRR
jgi:3-deoxy-8-phosphooctulonate synthase